MPNKKCSGCKESLPEENFNIKNKKTGALQSLCIICNKEYQQKHYQNNKLSYYKKARKYDKAYRLVILEKLYDYLIEHPCVGCGETDPIVLEFDHREQSEKEFDISRKMTNGASWEKLLIEIAKCDVRCANCHRRRTAKQLGWAKAAWFEKTI